MSNLENITQQYKKEKHLYDQLCNEVYPQIKNLVKQADIKLAVPIEYRIKEISSVIDKAKANQEVNNLSDINDIVGIRIITIFETDIEKVCNIIKEAFIIIKEEDTRQRLKENQFGYGSIHYEISLKKEWCAVPSFRGLSELKVEIQVRTAAQHIWAMSSHILQYKKETDVPEKVKRTINRLAALLELVDLEFARVLDLQDEYNKDMERDDKNDELLNIDNMKYILKNKLPKENESNDDPYSELIADLSRVEIKTMTELSSLIEDHYQKMMDEDKRFVKKIIKNPNEYREVYDKERLEKGVFYTYVGLIRFVLKKEYKMSFRS